MGTWSCDIIDIFDIAITVYLQHGYQTGIRLLKENN